MRKRLIDSEQQEVAPQSQVDWLDVARLASVEVTSEQADFPIEGVFAAHPSEWRAGSAGEQLIRLIFDEPLSIHRIQLGFEELHCERTQEFTLSWASNGELREIVRQQYTFSPGGTTSEVEEYQVDLQAVRTLELRIKPDIQHQRALASLADWHIQG
jgi:hypothetical protein